MTTERYIRIIAGTFILLSLALAHWVEPPVSWAAAARIAPAIRNASSRVS